MKTMEHPSPAGMRPRLTKIRDTEPAYQAFSVLYVGFTALPIIAGLDKFTGYLGVFRRGLVAAGHRRQPADDPGLLRRRAARLRPGARGVLPLAAERPIRRPKPLG